jgi:hypothetical protein
VPKNQLAVTTEKRSDSVEMIGKPRRIGTSILLWIARLATFFGVLLDEMIAFVWFLSGTHFLSILLNAGLISAGCALMFLPARLLIRYGYPLAIIGIMLTVIGAAKLTLLDGVALNEMPLNQVFLFITFFVWCLIVWVLRRLTRV